MRRAEALKVDGLFFDLRIVLDESAVKNKA
jgi:hypothetical protein